MRDYELVMLVSPQVADDAVPAVVDRVTQLVTGYGGTVDAVNPWGRRRLAYHIGNFEEASYVQANFKMEPKHAPEFNGSLRLSEHIIRHLLIRVGE